LPMIHSTGAPPDAAIFVFGGASTGGHTDGEVDEAISSLVVENDVAHGTRPRALVQTGPAVGGATGRFSSQATDRRAAVYRTGARRDLTFVDGNGRLVASVAAEVFEGTAFPDVNAGTPVSRVIAYGALSGGTGAFDGASGVLAIDTAIAQDGASATV